VNIFVRERTIEEILPIRDYEEDGQKLTLLKGNDLIETCKASRLDVAVIIKV